MISAWLPGAQGHRAHSGITALVIRFSKAAVESLAKAYDTTIAV